MTAYGIHGHGNINSGSGTQFNLIQAVVERPRSYSFVAGEHVRWLRSRFVPPARFPFDAFSSSKTAVLVSDRGAGGRTTALMLLAGAGGELLRAVSVDELDSDGDSVRPADRLLLDLSATDEPTVRATHQRLESYRAIVDTQDARLVVLVRPEQATWLSASLEPLVIRFDRPDGEDVLRAHLRAAGMGLEGRVPTPARLREHLKQSSMREITALARLTVDARDADPAAAPEQWLEAACTARFERSAQAAAMFRDHQDSAVRALLVVAAFLPGAPLEALVAAEETFRQVLRLPGEDRHPLDGAHLAERMTQVGLRADGRRTVQFTDLGMDAAVRDHFWTYFPSERGRLALWLRETTRSPSVSPRNAADLLDHFAHLSLRTGPAADLQRLATGWAGARRPELAARALSVGLHDDRWSRAFRQFVLDRSRDASTPVPFAQTLIKVCVEDIAPERPPQAMVRLQHLSRNHDPTIRAEAMRELMPLINDGFQRWALYRLAGMDLRESDLAIVAQLDVPRALLRDHHARRNLVAVWRKLLATEVAHSHPQQMWTCLGAYPELVVRACDGQLRLLNQLYELARRQVRQAHDPWTRTRDVNRARALQQHIDAALNSTALEEPR